MKKSVKIISILMIALMVISVALPIFAVSDVNPNMDLIKGSTVGDTLNSVLGALRYIGIFAAVAILMILGIKYMMGSAEEKAEYKKTLIPYVIGAVLLFTASFIVGIIADAANKVTNNDQVKVSLLLENAKVLATTIKTLV